MDEFIGMKDNTPLLLSLLALLEGRQLNSIDANDPEISDMVLVPSTESISGMVWPCLQETESFNTDFSKLFAEKLMNFEMSSLNEVEKIEKLSLIPPNVRRLLLIVV
jgi:intraflagellar transport protein 52